MKFTHILLAAAVVGEAVANWDFGKNAYNKWHQTDLERWLSDHGIPYVTPADRKDLERIVSENWQVKVIAPYQEWDLPQLQNYLSEKGHEVKKGHEDKDSLVRNVKKYWYETEAAAEEALGNVKSWIFDTWSDSQLKAFLDRHGIPNPSPRKRDTMLSAAQENYDAIANKLGETLMYPGNWLYESWTDSDLKKWLEMHGYPVPHPSTRDKLIGAVRGKSRLASLKLRSASDAAADKAKNAKKAVSDTVFDAWTNSDLRDFLDRHNIHVPEGATHVELIAIARRNKKFVTDEIPKTATSLAKSATAVGADKISHATDTAKDYGQAAFDKLIEQWSDSRLKSFLDSRGVSVPQNGKRDELLSIVRLHKNKGITKNGPWTFDTWTYENLKVWLDEQGQKASANTKASRDELYSSAINYYSSVAAAASPTGTAAASAASSYGTDASHAASSAGTKLASSASSAASVAGSHASSAATEAKSSISSAASVASEAASVTGKKAFASLTSALAAATDRAKEASFETWSDSEIKAYLDTYGIKVYQGSTRNELIALARRNAHAFMHGSQDQGVSGQAKSLLGVVKEKLGYIFGWFGEKMGLLFGYGKKLAEKAGDRVKEAGRREYDKAKENSQEAYDRVKEEL
ncbi:hypothetical protein RUND412_002594 [Rhizina undulata]